MTQPNEHIAIINEVLLAKSLLDWRKNPEVSLRRIFRVNCEKHFAPNEQHINTQTILNLAISSSLSNILRQTFVTNYEYLRHNIDDKMSNSLKRLKTSTSSSANNLNTTKFMDAIRQSLVHNDINAETPNWHLNNEFKVEINFKGNTFTFDIIQLHQIMIEFSLMYNCTRFCCVLNFMQSACMPIREITCDFSLSKRVSILGFNNNTLNPF